MDAFPYLAKSSDRVDCLCFCRLRANPLNFEQVNGTYIMSLHDLKVLFARLDDDVVAVFFLLFLVASKCGLYAQTFHYFDSNEL